MRRRTLIGSVLAIAATLPVPRLKAWAQALNLAAPDDALRELAATVLPSSLGRSGTDAVAAQFADWVAGYRAGAEMSHGYGSPRVRYKGPSPAPVYERQLQALSAGALATPDLAERRRRLAAELQGIATDNLPASPRGENVVVDLMAFYFSSPPANDLAYKAAVRKDACRGLASSGQRPRPLERG